MDLIHFMQQRRPRWNRLGELLDRVEKAGHAGLDRPQADELYRLYRLACSDLNLLQTRTGNPALLDELERLVARAYANVVATPRPSLLGAAWRMARFGFPRTVRDLWRLIALAAVCYLAGMMFGLIVVAIDPQQADLFLPAEHLSESPAQRVARLEAMERAGDTRIDNLWDHSTFSTFLFTHNTRVTILCVVLGLTFGVGTAVVLFFNGAMLGALAARYAADGVMTFFVAWIGPHGAVEIPCVLFAGGAGFLLARAQYRRTGEPFRVRLRRDRQPLLRLIFGITCLLIIAGVVEGGFSQVNEPTLPYPIKIGVAIALHLGLWAYLTLTPAPRQALIETREDQLAPELLDAVQRSAASGRP